MNIESNRCLNNKCLINLYTGRTFNFLRFYFIYLLSKSNNFLFFFSLVFYLKILGYVEFLFLREKYYLFL